VAASSFAGNDYGAIRISNPAALDPRGGVLHNGAFRDITGAGRVPVGSSACKTRSTMGTTCGTIGGCSQAGFRSFCQPADEALSTYGLTLL
jgi:streptogrisin A